MTFVLFFDYPNIIGLFLGNEKHQIPIIIRGDVVNRIRCECRICYIGQTGQSLKDHIYESRQFSEKQTLPNKGEQSLEEKPPIALHAITAAQNVVVENALPVITNVTNP